MNRPTFSLTLCTAAVFLSFFPMWVSAEPYHGPGIKSMHLLPDASFISPGGTLTVGLVILPEAGHHTYWKGPGIVGVATSIQWDLPEGFVAGPLLWPVPEKVDMVGITANGYRSDTVLLTEIKIPDTLSKDVYHLKAKVAWMACATSCNPGVTGFTLTLPPEASVGPDVETGSTRKLFESVRANLPQPAPVSWSTAVDLTDQNAITLTVSIPGLEKSEAEEIEFFCNDMQVNSDIPTKLNWLDDDPGTLQLIFSRPDFAPKNPSHFSGVLKSPTPLPSLESNAVEISVPWSEGTFPDE